MGINKTTPFANRSLLLVLLALAGYQLWLVVNRWIAVFKYLYKFGTDVGPWVTLGSDTVIFGLATLALVGALSIWGHAKAKRDEDQVGRWISKVVFILFTVTSVALLILIFLPKVVFRT